MAAAGGLSRQVAVALLLTSCLGVSPGRGATHSVYFAEGVTRPGLFSTSFSIVNVDTIAAAVTLRFLKDDGTVVSQQLSIRSLEREVVSVADIPGLESSTFSLVIGSNARVVASRTVSWPSGQHMATGIPEASTTWYLAEGATHSGFDLFYLIANPGNDPAEISIRYLLPGGAGTVVKAHTIAPQRRFTIWVDLEDPALGNTDVAAVITSTTGVPIVVERAMYLSRAGEPLVGGDAAPGVTAPSTSWHFAEGCTGALFDTFLLIANPNERRADVDVRYFLVDGTEIRKSYRVDPASRFNVWVDWEDPRLTSAAVSMEVISTNGVPIVVERSMWWPGDASGWYGSHASAGSPGAGTKWVIPDGQAGKYFFPFDGFILVSNASDLTATVSVTVFPDEFYYWPQAATLSIPGRGRATVFVEDWFDPFFGGQIKFRYSSSFWAMVESVGPNPAPIVVESSIYTSSTQSLWSSGSSLFAVRVP